LFCFYLGPYIRKDPEVLKSIDSSLSSGKSPDQVYIEINKENCYPGKFVNQKSIYNRNTNIRSREICPDYSKQPVYSEGVVFKRPSNDIELF